MQLKVQPRWYDLLDLRDKPAATRRPLLKARPNHVDLGDSLKLQPAMTRRPLLKILKILKILKVLKVLKAQRKIAPSRSC